VEGVRILLNRHEIWLLNYKPQNNEIAFFINIWKHVRPQWFYLVFIYILDLFYTNMYWCEKFSWKYKEVRHTQYVPGRSFPSLSGSAARAITLEALHVIRKVLRTCKIELFLTHSAEWPHNFSALSQLLYCPGIKLIKMSEGNKLRRFSILSERSSEREVRAPLSSNINA